MVKFLLPLIAIAHALNAEWKLNLHKEIPQSRIETSKSSIVCYEHKGSKILSS